MSILGLASTEQSNTLLWNTFFFFTKVGLSRQGSLEWKAILGEKRRTGSIVSGKSVARKEINDLIQGVEEHLIRKGRAFALRHLKK